MRLTLRTLLAYLDNTLDPQDADALKSKLGESGFATQLVQRIRNSLANGGLPAPSPEAVGPVEEANVISEYLDSTLPTEQVAEIERACLESDPHLAEAAACHQILTMVLGKPAEVSPELRQRIYELPDRRLEEIAAGGSFSGIAIPDPQSQQPLADEIPTADLSFPSEPVMPVGVADSGVADAPTRLREAGSIDGSGNRPKSAIAGSKPRSTDAWKVDGGSIRPSRITPWLVSLALTAVLLFLLTRIFHPLLDEKRTARSDLQRTDSGGEVMAGAATDTAIDSTDASGQTPSQDTASGTAEEATPATKDQATTASSGPISLAEEAPAATVEASMASETPTTEMSEEKDSPQTATSDVADGSSPSEATVAVADVASPTDPSTSLPADESSAAATDDAGMTADATPPASAEVASDADMPKPPADADNAPKELAKIVSDKTLIAARVEDRWVRLGKDATVGQGMKISCAPTFRAEMETADARVTLVGPAQVEWIVDEADKATLQIDFGHVLVSATKPDTTIPMRLATETIEVGFAEIDSVVGVSLTHSRRPGADPLKVENRESLVTVLSVQGALALQINGEPQTLETGQQWIKRGANDALVSSVETVPSWIDPPKAGDTSLEASARDGLLTVIKSDQPLEIALREAKLFRRSEVAALAAQSLLNLGISDVYFGGDGILSEPKQRAYWPDHFVALLSSVDRSAESAAKLRESIVNMDSANAQSLFRLLTGFSQKQLVEGGDEQLVDLLDSSSMAVRVMALESLHEITGTTLYFRAEQENAIRRAPVIKKWNARQRKGDIRWQE